jgi:hypothetical protein
VCTHAPGSTQGPDSMVQVLETLLNTRPREIRQLPRAIHVTIRLPPYPCGAIVCESATWMANSRGAIPLPKSVGGCPTEPPAIMIRRRSRCCDSVRPAMTPFSLPRAITLHRWVRNRITLYGMVTFVACAVSGCFSTHLSESSPPPDLDALVESAQVHLPLYVQNPLEGSSHGYQFLLIVLPITRVFPDQLTSLVTTKMTTHAGFGGYGLLSRLPPGTPTPRLEVSIESVSVNGYDLIVTRRPSASITLRGRLFTAEGTMRDCQSSGSFSEFARFAFAGDLEGALERATDTAAKELVGCLGLHPLRGTSASFFSKDVL